MKKIVIFLLILVGSINAKVFDPIGSWRGSISIMGKELRIKVNLTGKPDSITGNIDIPQQNAFGLHLSNIKCTKDSLAFDLVASPTSTATFQGLFKSDTIKGNLSQNSYTGNFYLVPDDSKPTVEAVIIPNYKCEEVVFYNGKIKLAGTLSFPNNVDKPAAIVLVTGSGLQTRDEEVFGFKVFAELADYLTKNGYAVLRYDDRGRGGSDTAGVSSATTLDFSEDAEAAFNYLSKRNDINTKKIGILGHSEGGTIAAIVAGRNPKVGFIILMAGSTIKGDSLLFLQGESMMRSGGAKDEEMAYERQMQELIFSTMRGQIPLDSLRGIIRKQTFDQLSAMSDEEKKGIPDPNGFITQQIEGISRQAQSIWFRFFIDYDPAIDLVKVKCPTLAIFGELDMQVPAIENKAALVASFEKSGFNDYKTVTIAKANHLFQKSVTGNISEYGTNDKQFLPEFLDSITKWLKKLK